VVLNHLAEKFYCCKSQKTFFRVVVLNTETSVADLILSQ